jgi:endonuclease/exonuclease/phosphatase family metal-dependent hydrolase
VARRKRKGGQTLWTALWLAGLLAIAVFQQRSASQRAGPSPEHTDVPGSEGEPARAPSRTRGARRRVPESSPFHSLAACEAQFAAQPRTRSRGPRIGTWNVRWFPYGASSRRDLTRKTDLRWLACVIASLDVDVLAVQEFVQDPGGRGALIDLRARLDALTGGDWREQLDDCPGGGFQHVGFLFDSKRVQLRAVETLAALNPGKSACDRSLRPGLGAYARFGSGPDLHLVALHLDSGVTARDFGHRVLSVDALERVLPQLARTDADPDLLVLGDFNTMGCKDCVPPVTAEAELARMDGRLRALSLTRLAAPVDQACSHYYRGKSGALDHIVAREGMEELASSAVVEVHGPCRDLACGAAAINEDVYAWQYLSDHCPIVIELQPRDRDR